MNLSTIVGRNHRSIVMVLLCVLCLLMVSYAVALPHVQSQRTAPPPKGDPKRVYLVHADELRYDRWQNNDAQVLIGSVQFEHDGAKLYCDSANFFEASNSFEAWGHVRMVQGDTLSLTSNQGYYDGNQQLMEAKDSVVLRHRKTTLYTDELYYDRIWNQGYFQNGGRLVDEGTTLTSDWGEYHTDTKMAIFYYDVKMVDKQFLLTTDSLYYDTQVKQAHAGAETHVAHFGTRRRVALLHGQGNVRNAGTLVGHYHVDLVGVDVHQHLAAVGMGNGVHLGLVKGHNHVFHHLWTHAQLLQRLLHGTRCRACIDKIAFDNCIFLMHLDECLTNTLSHC